MAIKPLPPIHCRVNIAELVNIADRAQATLANLRDDLLEPFPRKVAPTISVSRIAKLCGLDRLQINYLCSKGNKGTYPIGTIAESKRSRTWSLADAQEFIRANGSFKQRPAGQKAMVVSVGNFKGGVGKTTDTVAIAQGLTLKGHKVLLIDLDPQASSTTLMGLVPDAEVTENMTVMPAVYGDQSDLNYAVIPSYWDGLDFIPSCPALFGGDYYLPNKQATDPNFQFWRILDIAMAPLREKYDVIMIDTPPSLSYLAIGSFMATDGMIVPLPPETLDFASSTQFFRQFSELFKSLNSSKSVEKEFEFIKIVLSKVKQSSATTPIVKSWIKQTYHELLCTSEIIDTDIVMNASAEFKTLYDLTTYEGSTKTFNRAIDSFDAVVDEIEASIQNAWYIRTLNGNSNNGE